MNAAPGYQRHFANHVARMRADHAAAQDLAVAVGLGGVIKQQLGNPFVAPIGDGAVGCSPGESIKRSLAHGFLESAVIERILTHLGLRASAPPRVSARGDFQQAA